MSKFELSYFMPHSLSLSGNVVPQTKPSFKSEPDKSALELLVKEDPLKILGENVDAWKCRDEDKYFVETPLQRFYSGNNIFITGGTGFVGKVLIQKIIRSFPSIGCIYLLVRPKRGSTAQERLLSLLQDKVFLRMQTEVPQYLSKITVVEGDISEPGLGLSTGDRQMLIDNVNVIFHSAANVKFNEPLRSCMQTNVIGSRRVIELAKELKSLKAYVHVSTAYSNCVRRVIEEDIYEMSVNYSDILKYIEVKSDREIEEETPRLLQGWPNTYTFSKALTEQMIRKEAKNLPVCIFRPTVVISTYADPVRGWTDNLYGLLGVQMGLCAGIIHVYRVDMHLALNLVPVDYVVNSLIAVATDVAHTTRVNDGSIPVFNFSSSPRNCLNWKVLKIIFRKYQTTFPFETTVSYPYVLNPTSPLLDDIGHFFLHKIPGKALDKLIEVTGGKPKLSKIYDKLFVLKRKLSFFTFREWEFRNENISSVWRQMDRTDQEMFPFDLAQVDFESLMAIGILGLRYYFLKEKMETLPKSAQKLTRLKWVHYSLVTVACLTLVKFASLAAHALPI